MKTLHFASPPRALWGLLAALLLLSIASPAAAAPTFAVRTDLGISSLEGELFLGRFGLLALVQTGYESSLCTGTFSRALYGARWFFKRPQSSWYLGILSHTATTTAANVCTVGSSLDGTDWFGGYHWLLARNFSIDIGFRPNILQFGLAF